MNEIIKINPEDHEALMNKLEEAGVKKEKDLERPYPYLAVSKGWGLRIHHDKRVKRGELLLGTKEQIEEELCAR